MANKNGCPNPPPHLAKQNAIAAYHEKYGHSVLVETGTYLGDMVEAQKRRFKKIISIELGVELCKKAQKRFREDKNVTFVQEIAERCFPK
jgi:16S rRNA A1518/A1519 N6-dimethyltransferase RsmA/KsgA/DIM1 with predicted DNA glycosylase/AP lyase activity